MASSRLVEKGAAGRSNPAALGGTATLDGRPSDGSQDLAGFSPASVRLTG